jgi:Flp pilus assembly protein TadG
MARARHGERGQALTELALAMPVLALILFGLAELGIALNNQVAIVNASRDGARVAALQGIGDANFTTDVQAAVSNAVQPLISCPLDTGTPVITSSTNGLGGTQVASWTVQVSCTYAPLTPLGSLFGLFGRSTTSTYGISRTTTMRDSYCLPSSCSP